MLPAWQRRRLQAPVACAATNSQQQRTVRDDRKAWLSACWKVSKESTRRPSEEVTSVVEVVELASDTNWSIQPSSEAIDSTRFS